MPLGYTGEEAGEERGDKASEELDDAATFADLHNPHPESQDTGKTQRDLESECGLVERGIHHVAPHLEITSKYGATQRHQESDDEERDPDPV